MTSRLFIETLCLDCLAPHNVAEDEVRAAVEGRAETTFYCDEDLSYIGLGMTRPGPPCSCAGTQLIVRTRSLGPEAPGANPSKVFRQGFTKR